MGRVLDSAMILKSGSVAAIVGAIVLMVATMLHPMGANPDDPIAAFTEYAADKLWVASHLGQFLGIGLLFFGLYGLSWSLRGDAVEWLANLGLQFALAALILTAVLQAVDGIALKAMVDRWAAAAEAQKQSAFDAAFAVRQIEIGTASFVEMLFGTAGILFGISLTAGPRYPTWLGWLAIVGGTGTVVAGLLTAFTGFSMITMNVAMPFNLIMIVWIALTGVVMWRQANRTK
jgi:hypothetical protein